MSDKKYDDEAQRDIWRTMPESWKGGRFEKMRTEVLRKASRKDWNISPTSGCAPDGKLCDEGLRLIMEMVGAYARNLDIQEYIKRFLEHLKLERAVRRMQGPEGYR